MSVLLYSFRVFVCECKSFKFLVFVTISVVLNHFHVFL